MVKLSIVTTLYCSEHFISEFYNRTIATVRSITDSYEIIFVNDGSPDNSLALAIELCQNEQNVQVIDFSRNYGHHQAILAGLSHCSGELIFLLDVDLEESPELLEVFYTEFKRYNGSVDSIFGVQRERKGTWIERNLGSLFYRLFNHLSGIQLEKNPVTMRLMSNRYVNALLQHKEKELFLAGIFHIVGFNQKTLEIEKLSNKQSTYTLRRKLSLLVRGITSFSALPLRLSFYFGFFMSISSFLYGFYLIVRKLAYGDIIDPGWTSLMVSIWFIGGVILSSQGLLGIYLSNIYNEVKRRPNYIIREIYKKED